VKILFANGNPIFSSTRVRILTDLGFRVDFRRDAAQVLEAFTGPKETWPDILVMDNFLPQGDTEEVNEHSTYGYIRTGMAIYAVLRRKYIAVPTLIYTTDRQGHEELKLLCLADSRLCAVYECVDNSTKEITTTVQKLAKIVEAEAKTAPASPTKMDLSEC
jgi:CheY-like chemotaxis protein